ncbi:MAG: hypothetical protein IJ629_00450 [Clostridia bacterium]|nr:hypothetical protein [Clostridia bacterium]
MDTDNNNFESYMKYHQSQIIDNTISCLLSPKSFDELGNAVATLSNSSTNFLLKIKDYKLLEPYISRDLYKYGKVKQTAGKLLDCFIVKMTEEGFDNHTVTLSLREYAEMTGKKSLGSLRNQTNNDLKLLNSVYIKNEPKYKKGFYLETKLCKCTEKIENGKMKFKFNDDLFKILSRKDVSFFQYIPSEVLQMSDKATNSYLLYKRILSNCRSNAGTVRENIISISTLYNYCTTLPRYNGIDGIAKGVEGITQRLKLPLMRDLKQIKSFTFDYSIEDYNNANFENWLKQELQIIWKEELPGLQEQRDGREKHKKRQDAAVDKALVKYEYSKLKKAGGGSTSKHKGN